MMNSAKSCTRRKYFVRILLEIFHRVLLVPVAGSTAVFLLLNLKV